MSVVVFALMTLVLVAIVLGANATTPAAGVASARQAVEKRRARSLKTRPQVRKSFPDEAELRALARSVMKRQIHPLIVMADGTILDGECRWRGLMLERPDFEVDVIVVTKELTPGEVTELQLISALHSTSLTAYDQAVAIRGWFALNPGVTAKELAEKIDRDQSMVSRLNSLWKTVPEVVKAAAEGKIGVKAWHQISLLPESEQLGLLNMYLSGASVKQIEAAGRKSRTPNVEESGKTSSLRIAIAEVVITVKGTDLTLGLIAEAFEKAGKEAERAKAQGMTAKTAEQVWKDRAAKKAV